MLSKKQHLNAAKTYVILDTQVLSYDKLLVVLESIVKAGVGIVQLRDKMGHAKNQIDFYKTAKKITKNKTLLIANDRVDIALIAQVDGVHVGQDDLLLADVKRLVKGKMLIGVSCQNLAHARRAQQEGADYIGFGSIFKTKTKPDRYPMDLKVLQKVHKEIKIPIFPIGGIDRNNIKLLLNFGVKRAAICRDVLLAKDPGDAIKGFAGVIQW